MGHEQSKLSSSSESGESGKKGSRRSRLKNRLHFHRHRKTPSSSSNKLISAETFTGIALFALLRAEMQFKDKWIACLSLGEQTFRTKSSDQLTSSLYSILLLYYASFILLSLIHYCCSYRTDKPVWNSVSTLILFFID